MPQSRPTQLPLFPRQTTTSPQQIDKEVLPPPFSSSMESPPAILGDFCLDEEKVFVVMETSGENSNPYWTSRTAGSSSAGRSSRSYPLHHTETTSFLGGQETRGQLEQHVFVQPEVSLSPSSGGDGRNSDGDPDTAGASSRESSYQRYDIQQLAKWVEQILPFLLLLLVVFIHQHPQVLEYLDVRPDGWLDYAAKRIAQLGAEKCYNHSLCEEHINLILPSKPPFSFATVQDMCCCWEFSRCTCICWVPEGDGVFVAAHADGSIYVYEKVCPEVVQDTWNIFF
ncbi:hypothetical protein KSP40_PGU002461 [Platanthera guangdongensis]|uniref:Uncharacterized protein n=1 Tax=Platanthera guangdongensis TaxID=2320717 RepID=A0ABR2MHL5_9ASPA